MDDWISGLNGVYIELDFTAIKLKQDRNAAPLAIKEISAKDIAIIGISAQFPGADHIDAFWQNIASGLDCIGEFPETRRKDTEVFLRSLGKMNDRYFPGAYLGEIDPFDYTFFRLSPKEASLMSPNQRIFLEKAWHAIEDAGYGGKKLIGSKTGVYLGYEADAPYDYKRFIAELDPEAVSFAVPGNLTPIIASRISYLLDLHGPSLSVDTACSSALVAIHLACQAIRSGECDIALAGSIRLNLLPVQGQLQLGVESSDGRARSFDDSSDGTGSGEGVAAIVLKPLSRAIGDRDHIYAVIKGSAVNQDGSSIGITAPNVLAQEEVIVSAWQDAGIDPETITCIEAHGTGTKLGDPIEIDGIQRAFRRFTSKKQFCAIGSVKTNIGHLDNAAGMAGLIKMVAALQAKKIPPTLHFNRPNRQINFEQAPVYVNDRLRNWETDGHPRRCGISSFGFSGTNCHLVLEEAPVLPTNINAAGLQVMTLSAQSQTALQNLVEAYQDRIVRVTILDPDALSFTANTGRGHYNLRLAFIFENAPDFKAQFQRLAGFNPEEPAPASKTGIYYGEYKLVPASKKQRESNEFTDAEFNEFSKQASEKIKQFRNSSKTDRVILAEICALYIKGADIHWEDLYIGESPNRISLPGYPFERNRCWLKATVDRPAENRGGRKTGKPLLEYRVAGSRTFELYETLFSTEKHWVLQEHRIMGKGVLVGTTYLEMAVEAFRDLDHDSAIELTDIIFLTPLMLQDGEERAVQFILTKDKNHWEFEVCSQLIRNPGEEPQWVQHVTGKLKSLTQSVTIDYQPDEIKKRFLDGYLRPDLTSYNNTTVFHLGPRWRNIQEMYAGETELLSYLEMPAEFTGELPGYSLYPSLLDNALTTIPLLQKIFQYNPVGNPENIFLPFSYQSFRMYRSLPAKFYSYVRVNGAIDEKAELVSFGISLFDLHGKVLAEIDDYCLKKVHTGQFTAQPASSSGLYSKIGWITKEPATEGAGFTGGCILIFQDEKGIGAGLGDEWRKLGQNVIVAEPGPAFQKIAAGHYLISGAPGDYEKLLDELKDDNIHRIIHLMTITAQGPSVPITELDRNQTLGVKSLFYLTQALSGRQENSKLELWLIAEYVHEVTGQEPVIIPENAPLFGLAQALGWEHPNIHFKCIDIDHTTTNDQLMAEFLGGDAPDRMAAYRNGKRYVREFQSADPRKIPVQELPLRKDGVYVITGGAGGIGLEVARFLASKEQINLALLNRSPFPKREEWAGIIQRDTDPKLCAKLRRIEEIEAQGSRVSLHQVDVSQYAKLEKIIAKLRKEFGRINGLIHSAGVAGDGFIFNKEEKVFDQVLAPKVRGTRNLHDLTQADAPDFMILFSSVTSITGAPGQGDYTAANAYLDSFAAYRSKSGLRTLTINWAGWRETGMAADYQVNTDGLFKTLSTMEAIQAFEEVMNRDLKVIQIGAINYRGSLGGRTILDLGLNLADDIKSGFLRKKPKDSPGTGVQKPGGPTTVRLKGRANQDYNELETKIAMVWGEVLGYEEINLYDNFYQLGGDSISMMKIISRLGEEQIEVSFRDFVEKNNIHDLAALTAQQRSSPSKPKLKLTYPQREPDFTNLSLPFPLTNVQMAYLFGRDEHFELGGVSTHAYLEIETTLNLERFNRSLQRVIERHPMLRAVVLQNGLQQILPEVPEYQMVIRDLLELDLEKQHAEIIVERARMSHYVFPGDQWPLFEFKAFRLSAETNYLFIGIDVIIADAFSLQIIFKEILDYYENPALQLPDIGFSFRDYMLAYEEFKTTEAYTLSKRYWLDQLADFPAAPALPLKQDPSKIRKPRFRRLRKVFPAREWNLLKQKAQQKNITPSALICTAYAQLLAYWSNQPRLAINLTVFNRYPFHPHIHQVVGDFTSVVLLGLDLEPYPSFWDKARYTQGVLMEALEHRHYDGVEFIREIALHRNLGTNAIMPIVFTSMFFENPVEAKEPGTVMMGLTQTPQVYIDHQVTEQNGELLVQWDYVEDLFEADRVMAIFDQYTGIIAGLGEDLEPQPLPPAADLELYEQYNHTQKEIPPAALHQLFIGQVNRTPDHQAVIFDEVHLTYREIHEKSNQVAHYLVSCGVKRGERIGVIARRAPETIISLLGILKSGAAYVPVEPDYPEERRNYIISNSECRMVIGPELYQGIDLTKFPLDNPSLDYHPEDLAYVIYTSGSTGRPKGVMITHQAAANTIIDINQKFNVNENDRIMGISSLCFDLSVYDVFGALSTGAALVLIPDQRDIPNLVKTVASQGITLWNSVPAIMGLAVESLPENYEHNSLRLVMLSGDWIPLSLPSKIARRYPRAALFSLGGATEASIWSIYYPVREVHEDWRSVPYGWPLSNQRFYVLNHEQRLLPVGVLGELYIGGTGLAQGYFHDPEKTQTAFIQHPIFGNLYRTGDYGVFHREGYIEFLGRKDNQVKIRGFRIELGDIESCLLKYPTVKNAVVIDRVGSNQQKYLCAYLVAGQEPDKGLLRDFLANSLPEYMIPAYFLRLDKIPLTPNGKVDRNALPEPERNVNTNDTYDAPRNEAEMALARIWQEILEVDRAGIHDNFFELGGSSVQLMAVHSRVEKLFPGKTKITDLFIHPSIAKLATILTHDPEHPKIELKRVSLPGEFFTSAKGSPNYQTLRFHLDAQWPQKIKQFAVSQKVEVDKVLLMIYCYLLSQLSKRPDMVIQVMAQVPDTVASFPLNVNEIGDFQDFIRYYTQRITQDNYPIEEITRIPIHKAPHTILPLFYRKGLLTKKVDLLRYFDLIFEMEAGESAINFICEYDGQWLDGNKINELIQSYLKLVKYTITELQQESID